MAITERKEASRSMFHFRETLIKIQLNYNNVTCPSYSCQVAEVLTSPDRHQK